MLFVLGLVVVDVVILVTGILLDQLMTDNEDPEKKPNAEKESEISGVRIFPCNNPFPASPKYVWNVY